MSSDSDGRRVFVVFNPASDRGRAVRRIDRFLSLLQKHLPVSYTHLTLPTKA